jgi:hypothetical protein
MEHLWSKKHFKQHTLPLSTIVSSAEKIKEELVTAERRSAVLLWVELQAVIQMLIEVLATHFDSCHGIGAFTPMIENINRLDIL